MQFNNSKSSRTEQSLPAFWAPTDPKRSAFIFMKNGVYKLVMSFVLKKPISFIVEKPMSLILTNSEKNTNRKSPEFAKSSQRRSHVAERQSSSALYVQEKF